MTQKNRPEKDGKGCADSKSDGGVSSRVDSWGLGFPAKPGTGQQSHHNAMTTRKNHINTKT
ncbi:hypothetical protein [Photobacterium galatheae]|uniref:Uncharacterized protein n=1 Tax=Photobacterium galatheae TaxID=1654360 RepID=A0A066RMP9_9GAMM|nr:hypothetical protein [Photobacterium galatheae]KDM91680.1 hypothetical protein EA58_10380 [Photobacterium galatheae]MCM0151577.1 hypothetical protein [Photobacterium galatheae]